MRRDDADDRDDVGRQLRAVFRSRRLELWGRPDAITASAAGASATFTTPSTGTNNDWQHVSMPFTASSATTTVLLQGAAGVNYIGLDNASVDFVSAPAVPEPGTWALLLAGFAVLGSIVRRRA